MKSISQREARRLKKRVEDLERAERARFDRWGGDYPGGVHLGSWTTEKDWFYGSLQTAQKLSHVLVAKIRESGEIRFYAVPK